MSATSDTAPLLTNRGDQRLHGRYPIALELQYKLLNKGRLERIGFGRTVNISSDGVLFEADCRLPAGGPIELAMNWPYLLDGVVTLKLVMSGHVVRSDARAIAVKVEHHEFHTAGTRFREAMNELRWQQARQRVKRAS